MRWIALGVFAFGACSDDAADPGDTGEEGEASPTADGVFVELDTTVGPVVIEIHEEWAPLGAARFLELVEVGFYDDAKFFRVIPDFVVQFGMAADPEVHAMWANQPIEDDPVVMSNLARTVTFAATNLPNSRTTQVFINYSDNSNLDGMGFAPFGRVVEGTMPNVRAINPEYGEDPEQGEIAAQGNAYLDAQFPNLDGIVTATLR